MNKKIIILTILLVIFYLDAVSSTEEFEVEITPMNGSFIDPIIFSKSIANEMKVGESYTIDIRIKNQIDSEEDFYLLSDAPINSFYPFLDWKQINLDRGEIKTITLAVTPTNPGAGNINLSAKLYIRNQNLSVNSTFLIQDTVTKTVHIRRDTYSIRDAAIFLTFITIILGGIVIIKILR
jgi:hypothetical protein